VSFTEPVATDLERAGLETGDVERVIKTALDEDLRLGPDLTTNACVSATARGDARLRVRTSGVVAGLPVARAVLEMVTGEAEWQTHSADGEQVQAGQAIATLSAPLRHLLTAERTMLNLLTHLSGVATLTAQWVRAIDRTGAQIRDTRKTLPGLRSLEKYAVRCGGGINHRMALGDAVLIKDNHVAAAGGIAAAIAAVRGQSAGVGVEVECDSVDQVGEALSAGARTILLDNMSLEQMREAVQLAGAFDGAILEASGGLRLDNARAVAQTGVHYLAVGELTHSSRALDIGLDMD
jgi:nicotinate-nucleotide pyrophosphorylase (carboxylating)